MHSPALFLLLIRPPLTSTLFPYTTLFRSRLGAGRRCGGLGDGAGGRGFAATSRFLNRSPHPRAWARDVRPPECAHVRRSEEHTSELQSRFDLVCRLLLEKKNT